MTRRLEAGPLLVTLGGVLLLVSLFLSWFTGELSAWQAFEVWDLVLFGRHPQNIFEVVLSSTCTSSPSTGSYAASASS